MAALGTRGVDLGWMIFIHDFFQDICRVLEMEGMPGFMRSEDVAAAYAEASGVSVPDLEWYEVYAALRHAIVHGAGAPALRALRRVRGAGHARRGRHAP